MQNQPNNDQYKAKVEKFVGDLKQVLARVTIGDYSVNLEIPPEDDEFSELYVGVQLVIEALRDNINQLKQRTEELERLNHLLVNRELKMVELKGMIKTKNIDGTEESKPTEADN